MSSKKKAIGKKSVRKSSVGRPQLTGEESKSDELKEQLLCVAKRHFSRHGVQGASLKAIADDAGVANSLINYHFRDKQGLLQACMESFARHKQDAVLRILAEPKSREELQIRLELFVDHLIVTVMEDPEGFEILQQEVRGGNMEILEIFEKTLLKGFKDVKEFFSRAQKNGLIREDLDPMILAVLLFSSSCDSSRKDVFAKTFFNVSFNEIEWRQRFTQHVVGLFLHGVLK